uniref:Uncharacterized protein n=1 Tax=Fagus sylvatica TaxID=28930 RepID=A0A2N9J3J1_FAGSY
MDNETDEMYHAMWEDSIGKTKDEEMALVFGKDMATWNSAESYSNIDSDKRIVDLDSNDLDIDFEKASKGKQVSSSNAALSQARPHRKRNHANVIEDAVYDRLGKADQLAIKKLKKDQLDVNKLYKDVMKIEKFDEVMLASAFDYLVEVGNERVAKAFMAKNTRLRTVWLESFFNKNGGYRT